VERVTMAPIAKLVRENFGAGELDFLSLDIEGNELEIIQHLEFDFAKPKVMCIETLTYSRQGAQQKNEDLIAFVRHKGYIVYADTYINTIFVDQASWESRQG
jgi:Methyltransferase FkbM domain